VLSRHNGQAHLPAAVSWPPALLTVFGRYIQFNSAFGASVANLADEIPAQPGAAGTGHSACTRDGPTTARASILDGFRHFVPVQSDFMAALGEM
jgi:hypothetical protein